jgi:hypothetical protein
MKFGKTELYGSADGGDLETKSEPQMPEEAL